MADPTPVDVERLLEHAGWVRSLSRRLARDANAADDLEQQTWLAALKRPPAPDRPARRWLAAVLRNFARQERRGDARRTARESGAARPEGLPSTAELVERLTVQRTVASAVLQLEEPYRTTVLLRFYEGLPPRVIARRQGVPVETVKTRLHRGIERLRRSLDQSHGGNRIAWLSALVPLWDQPLGSLPSVLEAAVMNAKAKAVAAAVLVLGSVGVWAVVHKDSEEPVRVAALPPTESPERPVQSAGPAAVSPDEPGSRAPIERPAPARPRGDSAAPASLPAAPSPSVLRGRVVEASGSPAAGVRVELRSGGSEPGAAPRAAELPTATSGPDGFFEMPRATGGRIVAADPAYSTVLSGVARDDGASRPVLVVAARQPIGGRVVDDLGAPIEGAEVSVDLPEAFRMRFREVLDDSASVAWRARTAAEGAFALPEAPRIAEAALRVRREGFLPYDGPMPETSDANLLITLARPRSEDGWVRGRVLDPDGRPAPAARVAFGVNTTATDEEGRFAFKIDEPSSANAQLDVVPTTLTAVKRGYLPATREVPLVEGKPAWPSSVVLRLGKDPLSIRGRVVDAKGDPLPGMKVWIADATLFGAGNRGLDMVEGVLAGAKRAWQFVETGADGGFRIEGLLDRPYTLRAMDPNTLLRIEEGPFAAGSEGVVLRMPADAYFEKVAGRVLSHAGRPIEGARIFPMCDAFQARLRGRIVSTSHEAVDGTTTDASGHFELSKVPRSLVYLRVDGENLIPLEYGRYVEGDERFASTTVKELPRDRIENLEIVVDQRCHLKVELADPASADALAILDGDGRELTINIFVGDGRRENPRAPIVDGRSHTMAVSDTARTIVLYRGNDEVSRSPLELEPGKPKELRL